MTTYLEIDGIKKTIKEWSAESGTSMNLISTRIAKGLSHKDAVYMPKQAPNLRHKFEYNGQLLSVRELHQFVQDKEINICCLGNRLNKLKWDVERALSTPLDKTHNTADPEKQKHAIELVANAYEQKAAAYVQEMPVFAQADAQGALEDLADIMAAWRESQAQHTYPHDEDLHTRGHFGS